MLRGAGGPPEVVKVADPVVVGDGWLEEEKGDVEMILEGSGGSRVGVQKRKRGEEVDDDVVEIMMIPVGKGKAQPGWKSMGLRKPRAKCLRIDAYAEISLVERYPMRVLIDTGAEVNLIRRGLLRSFHTKPAAKKVRFVTANGGLLTGGHEVAEVKVILLAQDPKSKEYQDLVIPTNFY